jgi:hypothetical protein
MAALSQLSYGPKSPKCSREFVIPSPIDQQALVIQRWLEPQVDPDPSIEEIRSQEIARIDVGAVSRDRIDLIPRVTRAQKTVRIASTRQECYDDHVLAPNCPLALDPQEAISEINDQVVPAPFTDRREDV